MLFPGNEFVKSGFLQSKHRFLCRRNLGYGLQKCSDFSLELTCRHCSPFKLCVLYNSIHPWCEQVNFVKNRSSEVKKGQRKMEKSKIVVPFQKWAEEVLKSFNFIL